jgi:hypothetical protein
MNEAVVADMVVASDQEPRTVVFIPIGVTTRYPSTPETRISLAAEKTTLIAAKEEPTSENQIWRAD